MKTKSFFPKITALALILTLNAGGILTVGSTLAFFNDAETAGDSLFVAGILNFSLASDEWTPVDSAGALKSGDMITRHMSILAGDSIPFQYRIRTIKTSGDDAFCGALHMVASRGAVSLYDGVLMDFDLTPPVEIEGDGQDDWSFKMSMPTSAGSFVGKTCEFRFVVDGWQVEFPDGTGGFSDREALENILESDDTAREDGGQNISALEDSYGEQEHPDDTNGTAGDLRVKSQSGGKNKRAFVRFDFPFPDGTAIQSAALKMFMDDAPSASRTYAVARTLSPWTEASISWNNQPGTSSPMSASAVTGITDDQWLAWDVKDDASAFVAGTATNYGWTVFDAMESSATAREGKFSSSENSHQDKRPVLEVAFSAPPATTSHIVINEVYADVGDGRGSEGTNEWVELYNPTESAVDIKDWQVCDAASCDSFATTSSSIMLPSRGFAVVTAGTSTWQHWVLPEGAIRIVLGANIGGGLANPGDAVILKNASSAEIDAMSYGTDTSKLNPAVPVSGEGNSLARIVKGYDAELANDWIINATANPGTNPSEDGTSEVMRFTSRGSEVAAGENGLPALDTTAIPDEPEKQILKEEPPPEVKKDGEETEDAGVRDAINTDGEPASSHAAPTDGDELPLMVPSEEDQATTMVVVESHDAATTTLLILEGELQSTPVEERVPADTETPHADGTEQDIVPEPDGVNHSNMGESQILPPATIPEVTNENALLPAENKPAGGGDGGGDPTTPAGGEEVPLPTPIADNAVLQ